MTRHTAIAALAAGTALLLPAPPASACGPSIGALTAPSRAVAGADVRLSGRADVDWCPDGPGSSPRPALTTEETARPGTGGGPLPTITLPPQRLVAYAPQERARVTVTLTPTEGGERTGPARVIATVLAHPAEPRAARHSFDATVTIPADVATGRYVIEAKQADGVWFGSREIDVASGLAATGSGDAEGLARTASLAILAGAGALLLARRVERR